MQLPPLALLAAFAVRSEMSNFADKEGLNPQRDPCNEGRTDENPSLDGTLPKNPAGGQGYQCHSEFEALIAFFLYDPAAAKEPKLLSADQSSPASLRLVPAGTNPKVQIEFSAAVFDPQARWLHLLVSRLSALVPEANLAVIPGSHAVALGDLVSAPRNFFINGAQIVLGEMTNPVTRCIFETDQETQRLHVKILLSHPAHASVAACVFSELTPQNSVFHMIDPHLLIRGSQVLDEYRNNLRPPIPALDNLPGQPLSAAGALEPRPKKIAAGSTLSPGLLFEMKQALMACISEFRPHPQVTTLTVVFDQLACQVNFLRRDTAELRRTVVRAWIKHPLKTFDRTLAEGTLKPCASQVRLLAIPAGLEQDRLLPAARRLEQCAEFYCQIPGFFLKADELWMLDDKPLLSSLISRRTDSLQLWDAAHGTRIELRCGAAQPDLIALLYQSAPPAPDASFRYLGTGRKFAVLINQPQIWAQLAATTGGVQMQAGDTNPDASVLHAKPAVESMFGYLSLIMSGIQPIPVLKA